MLKVAAYPSDRTACTWQRCWFPLWWARKLGLLDVRFCYGADQADSEWADLFLYQRHTDPGAPFLWWKMLGATGKPRVYEIDDDVFCMPKDNPFWQHYVGEVRAVMQGMVREADLVLCSTDGLAGSMSRFNKRTAVAKNGVDPQVFDLEVRREPGRVRVVFCGSRTHDKDFALAFPSLKRALRRHPRMEMVFVGDPPTGAVESTGCPERTFHVKWVPFELLYARLAEEGPDVFVAPLTNHPFNRAKSAIKFYESAALGAALIASPVSDFATVCAHGETALLAQTEAEWDAALDDLVGNPEKRQDMAARAKKHVRENFAYDVLAPQWASVLESVAANGRKSQP